MTPPGNMTNCAPDYAWLEVTHGVWERDVDEIERFYTTMARLYEGSGRMFFAMTGHISLTIKGPVGMPATYAERKLEESLRKAWVMLRYDHPTIAASVVYDASSDRLKKIYTALVDDSDKLKQNAWLDQSFKTISVGQTGVEWCNQDPPTPKIPTIFVVNPGTPSTEEQNPVIRRDIVFRSPHDIVDGIGTLHLFQNFLAHAAAAYNLGEKFPLPNFGIEAENLSPSFRLAADIPSQLTEEQQRRFQAARTSSGSAGEVIGMPFKYGAVVPGKHQRVARSLNEDRTAWLLGACKTAGATVTHAYHAAIAICLRDLQQKTLESKRVSYVSYILRNERRRCLHPYNTSKHAAAVYHSVSGKPLVVKLKLPADGDLVDQSQRKKEFSETLHYMRDFYHEVDSDEEHVVFTPHIWAASTPAYPKEFAKSPGLCPVPPPKALASVSISSMGLVDRIISPDIGPFEVHDPWVTGEELGNGLGLFLGTFRGQLSLSAAYNEAWQEEAQVLQFLEDCENVVFEGLR